MKPILTAKFDVTHMTSEWKKLIEKRHIIIILIIWLPLNFSFQPKKETLPNINVERFDDLFQYFITIGTFEMDNYEFYPNKCYEEFGCYGNMG